MKKKLTKITDLIGYDGPRDWLKPIERLQLDAVDFMKSRATLDFTDSDEHRRTLTTIYLFAKAQMVADEAGVVTFSIRHPNSNDYELDDNELEKIRRALTNAKGQEIQLRTLIENDPD